MQVSFSTFDDEVVAVFVPSSTKGDTVVVFWLVYTVRFLLNSIDWRSVLGRECTV